MTRLILIIVSSLALLKQAFADEDYAKYTRSYAAICFQGAQEGEAEEQVKALKKLEDLKRVSQN